MKKLDELKWSIIVAVSGTGLMAISLSIENNYGLGVGAVFTVIGLIMIFKT